MPILDYSGFILLSLCIDDKKELQTMQSDVLRFCYNVRLKNY